MISLGKLTRKILPTKVFFFIAHYYREFFLDTQGLINSLPEFPKESTILDIGGGDGALLNKIFKRFPDIEIIMIDTASNIGSAINAKYLNRIQIYPKTSIQKFTGKSPDYIIIFDVLHHIPPQYRLSFFKSLAKFLKNGSIVIIKDAEPGGIRSKLAFLADYYISGDKTVAQISKKEIFEYFDKTNTPINISETSVFENDAPNYCIIISLKN